MSDTKKSAGGAATPSADKQNNSTFIIEQAKAKIKVSDEKKLGRYEKAVNSATAAALRSFCEQSEEFARAVIDGKSYDECLKTSCKGIGVAISDLDMFTRAAQFYFPGVRISYTMTLHMSEYELEDEPEAAAPKAEKTDISLSLDSLLDW